MRKNKLFKIAGIALFGALSQAAFASDGLIRFTGEIVDAPCTVSPAQAGHIFDVPLGSVSRTMLDGMVGKRGPRPTEFAIDLLNCGPTAAAAVVSFSGTSDADNSELLRLLDTGSQAIGVGIEIAEASGSRIGINADAGPYTLSAGDNSLKFVANYVSTLPTVTAGVANSIASFTVAYP